MTDERFLVVDDDDLMLDTLKTCLSLEGFNVETASSGPMAVELAKTQEFDVIISDVMMPGMSGIETIRAVKALNPAILSIVITGYASAETPVKAIKVGVDDYIYKPFDLDEFIHTIKRNIQSRRMKRHLEFAAREKVAASAVQTLLLPKVLPHGLPLSAAACYAYSHGLGGDYYDLMDLGGGRWAVLMGDVSGHDIASALVMVMVRTLAHQLLQEPLRPSQVLERLTAQLHHDISQALYVTLFLGVLDLDRNELVWANSGLPPAFIVNRLGLPQKLYHPSVPLGIFETGQYVDQTTPFLTGDTLWLYTDGVVDTVNPAGEDFSEDRLKAFFHDHRGEPVAVAAQKLHQTLENFRNKCDLLDDYTYLGVHRGG